jgi:hypothetical protein
MADYYTINGKKYEAIPEKRRGDCTGCSIHDISVNYDSGGGIGNICAYINQQPDLPHCLGVESIIFKEIKLTDILSGL